MSQAKRKPLSEAQRQRRIRWARRYRSLHKEKLARYQREYFLSHRHEEAERAKRWKKQNPQKEFARQTRSRLRFHYGLEAEDYARLFEAQHGLCAICGSQLDQRSVFDRTVGRRSRPHIDHDHNTGELRGLLCGGCNRGLGAFKDSVPALLSAVNYLGQPRPLLRKDSA
jgi:hypothetical protein